MEQLRVYYQEVKRALNLVETLFFFFFFFSNS